MLEPLLDWLVTPLSGATEHTVAPVAYWHARLMVVAWAFAAPLAVLLARYFKIMPRQRWPQELDDKTWWHGHRTLNYVALALSVVAVGLVWGQINYTGMLRDAHAFLGWSLLALAMMQLAGGHLRGSKGGPTAPRLGADGQVLDLHGDHYDMSRRRIVFERIHKSLGYLALLLTVPVVWLGLWTADAPRWMAVVLAAWWIVIAVLFAYWQRRGRCIDTYQAIWGADPDLPGNRIAPIGWGVRRMPPP